MDIDVSEVHRLAFDIESSTGQVGAKVARAVVKTAYEIERDAKINAPVDTGALRSSISTTITGDGRFGAIEAEIGPTVEYALFVEEGTSVHAPQPFMRPAGEKFTPRLVALVADLTEDIL